VIKAYVDKQRQLPQKMAKDKNSKTNGRVEIGGLWSEPEPDDVHQKLEGGRFIVDLAKKPIALATAAPGVE
jgi:hypothetical protein